MRKQRFENWPAAASLWSSLILGVCLLGVGSGCQSVDDLQGNGLDERTSTWSSGFRRNDNLSEAAGVSTRARQIEGNLGIR